jgi:hypothetical protein
MYTKDKLCQKKSSIHDSRLMIHEHQLTFIPQFINLLP